MNIIGTICAIIKYYIPRSPSIICAWTDEVPRYNFNTLINPICISALDFGKKKSRGGHFAKFSYSQIIY